MKQDKNTANRGGPFRINGRSYSIRGFDTVHKGEESADNYQYDTYFERLIKLIPGEVLALYMVGRGLIPPESDRSLLAWTIICIFAVVVVRGLGSHNPSQDKGAQWQAVTISAVSFLIWIYSIGDVFVSYNLHSAHLGSLAILTWTFFVPYFYHGDEIYSSDEKLSGK